MPAQKEELPSTIKRSPKKVQRTYMKALDNAHEQYRSEERAHRTAWDAVKHVAEKQGDHWELKDEPGPSDPQSAKRGPAARRGGKTYGGVNVCKPKEELYEEAREAGIEGPLPDEQGGARGGARPAQPARDRPGAVIASSPTQKIAAQPLTSACAIPHNPAHGAREDRSKGRRPRAFLD